MTPDSGIYQRTNTSYMNARISRVSFTDSDVREICSVKRVVAVGLDIGGGVISSFDRVDAAHGWKIGRGRCDGLDSGLSSLGDDRHLPARFLRLGGLFLDLDFVINPQDLRHLLLELGVATFQIVPHLVRLYFLLSEKSCTLCPARVP